MRRSSVLFGMIGVALLAVSPCSAASDYPNQPIQIIVPFSAGGITDLLARVMADEMQTAFKQPVTVINRPGGAANIGAAVVAFSSPDGYNILLSPPGPFMINQYLYPKLPFDPDKSFTPVTVVASFPNVMVVHPSYGVKTIQQFIDKAQAQGKVDYASGGIGATSHLAGAMFADMAHFQINHIPYKGTAQSIQDVVAGRVGVTIDNIGPLLPFIESGQLLALGVATREPIALLPGVPTIASVLKGFEMTSWNAFVVRAGTPKDVIDRLSIVTNEILKKPEVIKRLATFGTAPVGGTPEQTAEFFEKEKVHWHQAVEAAKIGPDQIQ